MDSPYFTFIPWDYDNCLGIDYFGTRWQYTDVLDWPGSTRRYWRGHATSRIPLVQNLLRNRAYRQYYLDHLEHLLETEFNPRAIAALIDAGPGGGLWGRVRQGAYLEAETPHGWPFTGRQFTNDEVYRTGCRSTSSGAAAGRSTASSTTSGCGGQRAAAAQAAAGDDAARHRRRRLPGRAGDAAPAGGARRPCPSARSASAGTGRAPPPRPDRRAGAPASRASATPPAGRDPAAGDAAAQRLQWQGAAGDRWPAPTATGQRRSRR